MKVKFKNINHLLVFLVFFVKILMENHYLLPPKMFAIITRRLEG